MAHEVVCRIRVDEPGRGLEFTWSVGSSAFPTYSLQPDLVGQFRDNVQTARDKLFELVGLYRPAVGERDRPAIQVCCLEMARAGRDLYNLIFAPEAEPKGVTRTVRRWLREVSEADDVKSLEIVSEGQPWFVPWNVVYDADPDEELFLKADPGADGGVDLAAEALRPFWGLRYNLCGGLPVEPLRRRRLPVAPDILLVIDPIVRDDLALHVDEAGASLRTNLLEFVAAREQAKARVATSREQLRKALKKRPHLIYWLGHAEPAYLALGDDRVSLADLGNFLRDCDDGDEPATGGGLVFLNACQTAKSPERSLGSFLKAFHDANFSGIIATEERTIDNVASPFGLEVLKAFLDGREPIGEVLRRLRTRYAPFGLVYGTYCPPDLQLCPEGDLARPDPIGQIRLGGTVEGVMLGGSEGREAVVDRSTKTRAIEDRPRELPPLPDEPYLPLASYSLEYRALFAGRDDDVERFSRVLGRQDTRVLILHGESGVGKSSFLSAGVIPYLDDVAVGFRFLEQDGKPGSVLLVRATDDPVGQVAEALANFAARPYRFTTPAGDEREVDLGNVLAGALEFEGPIALASIRAALLADPSRLDRAFGALASALPFTLILVIDQAEEMFTLANPDGSGQADRDRMLRMLSKVGEGRGDYKVIVSLRTEFYGRLIGSLRQGPNGATGVRDYLLADLDRDALISFVTRPTTDHPIDQSREIPRDRYGFRYAEGVPETLASELLRAGRKDGVLPLAQVICGQLWERVLARGTDPSARVVTLDDLAALGGFAGALRRHVEAQIEAIIPARAPAGAWILRTVQSILPERYWTRETFQRLMADLTLSQVDGTLTTALLSESKLASDFEKLGGLSFAELLRRADASRLLRTTVRRGDDGLEERSISLGHDALARVAFPWQQEIVRRRLQVKWCVGAAVGMAVLAGFVFLSLRLSVQGQALRVQGHALENAVAEAKKQTKAQGIANAQLTLANEKTHQALDDVLAAHKESVLALAKSEESRNQAQAVGGFLVKVFRKPDPMANGKDIKVAEVLDQAFAELEKEFQGNKEIKGVMLQALGNAYLGLGLYEKSEPALRQSLEITGSILGVDDPQTLLARSNLAVALSRLGRTVEAIALLESTIKLQESKLSPDHPNTLDSRMRLAVSYRIAGRIGEAITLMESTIKLMESKLGPDHLTTLECRSSLADIYRAASREGESIALYESTLKLMESKLGPDHLTTLECRFSLAAAYAEAGRLQEGIGSFESILKLMVPKLGADHPDTLTVCYSLANAYAGVGRQGEAVRLHESTLRVRELKLGADNPDTISSRFGLAAAYDAIGRHGEAIALFEVVARWRKSHLGPDNPATLVSYRFLANAYKAAGRYNEAVALHEMSLRLLVPKLGLDHRDTIASRKGLAAAYSAVGRWSEAQVLLEAVLEQQERKFGYDNSITLTTRFDLAVMDEALGRWAEAESLKREVLAYRRRTQKPDSLLLALVLADFAQVLLRQSKWPEAEANLREATSIFEKAAPRDWRRFEVESLLGQALLGQGQYAQAEPLLVAGFGNMKAQALNIPAQFKPGISEAGWRVVRLYEAWGKPDQAKAWESRHHLTELPVDVFARP